MNLETFNLTVVPTLGKHKITTKGFYMKFRLQSIYKTEFPFNNEYERYFLIEDNVYKLSDSAKIDINQAFKQEVNCNDIVFSKTERTTLVNVPFERFILVNEQVTDNLIIVNKDRSSETIVKEYQERYEVKSERTAEQYEKEQMEKRSKIDKEIENIDIEFKQNTIKSNTLETTQDFQNFIVDVLDSCENTLISKGREYTETNWLDNFEEACKFKGLEINSENLIKVLDGYRLKHQISIIKLQKDIVNGKTVNVNLINEKYGDLMNYNLLEQAIILKYNHINKVSF